MYKLLLHYTKQSIFAGMGMGLHFSRELEMITATQLQKNAPMDKDSSIRINMDDKKQLTSFILRSIELNGSDWLTPR